MYIVSVPYWVMLGKKKPKPFYLNLNTYRNAHFQTLNKAKEAFHDICKDRLANLPVLLQVALTYTLYTKTNQLCDTANICCIVDKFFCDSLVEYGKIPDDNYQIVKGVDFRFGGVDKSNPRVEVSIEPVGLNKGSTSAADQAGHIKKEETMQITIVQTEIEAAIRNHILGQVAVKENMRIDITLRATRGAEGYQALIDIVPSDAPLGTAGKGEGEDEGSNLNTTGASSGAVEPKAEPEVSATVNNENREEAPAAAKSGSLFKSAKEPVNA